MSTPEQEVQNERKKRTIWLLAGGAISLILPLLGVVYIRVKEAKTARPPDSSVMFDRRESGNAKINVTQTVTIFSPVAQVGSGPSSLPVAGGRTMTPAPGGSSLDFVKSGSNNTYYQDKPAAAPPEPPASSAKTATVDVPEPEPASKTVAQKSVKKPFNIPKLQGVKGFGSFKGSTPKQAGGKGAPGIAIPAGVDGGDMADVLKSVPPGANVQKYLNNK